MRSAVGRGRGGRGGREGEGDSGSFMNDHSRVFLAEISSPKVHYFILSCKVLALSACHI